MHTPHQQRVIEEKSALDEKREKLSKFMDGDVFESLPPAERERMIRQRGLMLQYSDVLAERIEAFPP